MLVDQILYYLEFSFQYTFLLFSLIEIFLGIDFFVNQNENRPKPKPGIIPFDERTNLLKSKYLNFNKKLNKL